MIKLRTLLIGVAVLFAFPVFASADAPPGPFFNGFETDTAGWSGSNGSTIARVASGSPSMYANGAMAATGGYYARLGKAPQSVGCSGGGGTLPYYVGPFTKFGGYSSTFPTGGYSTGVDIYLDVPYAQTHLDTRFDWDSSISNTSGDFRRDYVFNVGTDPLGFVISTSNNANRCGVNPTGPIHVTQSGWYTFKHTFTGADHTPVIATLQVIQKTTNVVIGSWTLSNPADVIGTTVGGNHYGWFVQNEFDGLPIDNSFRTGIDPTTTTVSCTPATFGAGSSTICTATVTDTAAGQPTPPTGTVSFTASPANGTFAPNPCLLATSSPPDTSQCTTTYSSTIATTETITANYGGDVTHSGSSNTTTVTVTPGQPANVAVNPPTATNPVDTQHCVTATVTDASGNPVPGVTVVFSVTGVNNPPSATSTTNATGTTGQYCYVGVLFGTDTITAAVDSNNNGQPDSTDHPRGIGTKVWTPPMSTQLCQVDFTTYGGWIIATNKDKASFGGNARVDDQGVASGQEEYQDHGPANAMNVKSTNVLAVVCTRTDASHATAEIFGQATIDGSGTYAYRIDVADNGEPGTNDTYEIRLSNGYDSGMQTLSGGNVQIH